jgi:hypothetical protein
MAGLPILEELGVLGAALLVANYFAQIHTDKDGGRLTICGVYDTGSVLHGGFTFAGYYLPLLSGHFFAFDASFLHGMAADDAVAASVERWTSAIFLNEARIRQPIATSIGFLRQKLARAHVRRPRSKAARIETDYKNI